MGFLVFWLAFTVAVGFWASRWNRSGFGWGLLAAVISPLLAGIFLAIAGRKGKKCPDCAKIAPIEARVCPYCRHEFPTEAATAIPDRVDPIPLSVPGSTPSPE